MPDAPNTDPGPEGDARGPLRRRIDRARAALRAARRGLRRDRRTEPGEEAPTGELTPGEVAIRLLREALPPRWKLYALSVFCMIGVAGFTGALAWSTQLVVNDLFVAGDVDQAYWIAALLVFIAIGKSGFDYANALLATVFTRSISSSYMKMAFARFMEKDVWAYLGKHPAATMAQVRIWGSATGKVVVNIANKLITDALTLLALCGVMIVTDPIMSLTGLVLFPIIFLLISKLSKQVRAIAKAESELTGGLMAVGTEAFDGIRTIKSYGLEGKSISKFNDAVRVLEQRIFKIARTTSATLPAMELLGGLVLGAFVIYAAWQTLTVGKTPGEFTAFITAFLMAYQPAERVSKTWVDLQKALIQAEMMYRSLEAPPVRPPGGTIALESHDPSIAFENVSFRYSKKSPALHNIDLEIPAGARVAIMGRSGAGKTSLIDLVQRFYDPTKGTVRIGGQDLREVSDASLRNSIALISQDVFLFEGSIRDNIRDGRPDATDAEIEEAARRAALHDVEEVFPDGLDSEVGPNGGNLSGGQKQRVGIARALLRQARIYIFDEATSALDMISEREILQNIASGLEGTTCLFVTHRQSTLAYVDRVLFLDAGRVIGFGTHEELLRLSPAYREMVNAPPEAEDEMPETAREDPASGQDDALLVSETP